MDRAYDLKKISAMHAATFQGSPADRVMNGVPYLVTLDRALPAMISDLRAAREMLRGVQAYHQRIKDECTWHLEANEQVSLNAMLADIDALLRKMGG